MKKFETPILEIEKLAVMNVITTSYTCETDGGDGCDSETPMS